MTPLSRRFTGILLVLTGALVVFAEILWTTGDTLDLPLLPPFAARILVFILGMTGLALIYLGFVMARGK